MNPSLLIISQAWEYKLQGAPLLPVSVQIGPPRQQGHGDWECDLILDIDSLLISRKGVGIDAFDAFIGSLVMLRIEADHYVLSNGGEFLNGFGAKPYCLTYVNVG